MVRKTRLFVEAGSLAEPRASGVGHAARSIIEALLKNKTFSEQYEIILIVAYNKTQYIDEALRARAKVAKLYVPGKIMNGLTRFNLMPPMDIVFGKGVYLFPNFKNWPLARSPSLTYIHDVYFRVEPRHIQPRNLSFLERNIKRIIHRATRIITVSAHGKSEIEKYYPRSRGKVTVVPNGIERERFSPQAKSVQEAVCQRYRITPGKYFMFLSNIEPRKNIERVLEAYEIFLRKTPGNHDIALLLVGGMGWNNEVVLARIEQLRKEGMRIIIPDHYVPDEDIPALLSGAIALVHPALYEGFGITPLEAMACGIPVIVARNSSIPEVVGDSYTAYVDAYSSQSIASRMQHIVEAGSSAAEIADGMKRAALFTWERSAEVFLEVLESIDTQ